MSAFEAAASALTDLGTVAGLVCMAVNFRAPWYGDLERRTSLLAAAFFAAACAGALGSAQWLTAVLAAATTVLWLSSWRMDRRHQRETARDVTPGGPR